MAILAHKGLAGITLGSTMLLATASQTQFLLTGAKVCSLALALTGLFFFVFGAQRSTVDGGLLTETPKRPHHTTPHVTHTALVFSAATPFGVGVGVLISSYCHSASHRQMQT